MKQSSGGISSVLNTLHTWKVVNSRGITEFFQVKEIQDAIDFCNREGFDFDFQMVLGELSKNIYDGISSTDLQKALVLSVYAFSEKEPFYDRIAARLLLISSAREMTGANYRSKDFSDILKKQAFEYIQEGIGKKMYDPRMNAFDWDYLLSRIDLSRDFLFSYQGLKTLHERYFLRLEKKLLEIPQIFWLRVAAGLCLDEKNKEGTKNKEERVIEFYNAMSLFQYVPSTPTLFHSGLVLSQLSSCYVSTIGDDLKNIFKVLGDNAQLSKYSGGIGNDWSSLRATGALIRATQVESQGVIPFLKIANDITIAINRSGRRRGATCAYLEVWHYDIDDFVDLRRNTGDERRRTHDMSTAVWIPDLFLQRVQENGTWSLFSPDETPELHEIYGAQFKKKYEEYEEKGRAGKLALFQEIEANKLWKRILTRLFETGHPWITFKDPCNVRSPQDHVGVVHNSNLCTEIVLNNSLDETAVCNLGSINLKEHIKEGALDLPLLKQTIKTAVRMLDNVIDLCFYPIEEAKRANMRHRPVGLGIMGLQDAFFKMRMPVHSQEALEWMDRTMEVIAYEAYSNSSDLALERGMYESFRGSKWDRGIFPLDTLDLLEQERGEKIYVNRISRLDWDALKAKVKKQGMRNSNVLALAPTATISNIVGCFPTIEPIYKNLYVKSTMTGEFLIFNEALVNDLKALNLWDEKMRNELKYYDGDLSSIERIPDSFKLLYKDVFQIDPLHLVHLAALRSKWIDQSQSYNIFLQGSSGAKVSEIYFTAWKMGLKTTYYMRSLGATQTEKATLGSEYGYTQKRS